MEAVIDQTLGNVVIGNAGLGLQWSNINDCLMGNQIIFPGVEKWVGVGKLFGNVVGTEHGDRGCIHQALVAHHLDVGPGDWQNAW